MQQHTKSADATRVHILSDVHLEAGAKPLKVVEADIVVSVSKKVDLTASSKLSPEEADSRVYKLAQSGDKMAAVKMTRELYGCSLSEAVAYVEDLQSKGPAPAIKSAP